MVSPFDTLVLLAGAASLVAGLATGVGAIPVFLFRSIRPSTGAMLLGFGAGVMLAATSFSLVVPGIAAAERLGASALMSSSLVSGGMLVGALAVLGANHVLPHEHFIKGPEGAPTERVSQIWLFVIAIALHNFPEGLAMGVGFGGGDVANGLSLATGMALQNLPEGYAVAVALTTIGHTAGRAFIVALFTGLIEPIGGLIGVSAVSLAESLLPPGMGFAAGAMLFVISSEIIPESHREGQGLSGTVGVLLGFIVMMLLDTAFG